MSKKIRELDFKMKIALIIAGYLRGYENNINYIKEKIINKYKTVDVYLHITEGENFEDKYLNQIKKDDIEKIISTLKPVSTIIESNVSLHKDKRINNIINQWSKLYKLNELKKINENVYGEKYSLVIRYRPDLEIYSDNMFDVIEKNTVYIPKDSKIDRLKLTDHSDKYLCDALAFGESSVMDSYFNIYKHVHSLIEKYGSVSETILHNYLNTNFDGIIKLTDIDYAFNLSKCNVFAICGDSGSGKSTLSNLLQSIFTDSFKLECDRYHKWERGNENWGTFTHLNPKANHITKMSEDIFNLKIGNDIYQVDYDHTNGRFTEKQLINPSSNLIVCGLHSLYIDENRLYDLKIYMDTQDKLKTKWKINRDVKERGYTIESVINNINRRSSDFNEFIEPQKSNADLIVRFFTDDDINYDNLNYEPNISLSLSVSDRFDISNILKLFKDNDVHYTLSEENSFNIVTFKNYKQIHFLNHDKLKTNTFYDYVLYFIINLT